MVVATCQLKNYLAKTRRARPPRNPFLVAAEETDGENWRTDRMHCTC